MQRYERYAAVSAATSKHFSHRVFRTKKAEQIPGAFLEVLINPTVPMGEVIKHLDLIRDWLITGEDVQSFHPDCFYGDLEEIPNLVVYANGQKHQAKRWRAKDTKGNQRLI